MWNTAVVFSSASTSVDNFPTLPIMPSCITFAAAFWSRFCSSGWCSFYPLRWISPCELSNMVALEGTFCSADLRSTFSWHCANFWARLFFLLIFLEVVPLFLRLFLMLMCMSVYTEHCCTSLIDKSDSCSVCKWKPSSFCFQRQSSSSRHTDLRPHLQRSLFPEVKPD